MKFKVGDTVKCLKNRVDMTKDKYYKIVSISDDGYWYRVIQDNGILNSFSENFFELVETTHTWHSKFNIGDKVITKYGEIEIIKCVSFYDDYIEYEMESDNFFLEQKLSLYEEPKHKEMTVAEIEEELGYSIKVVK